MSKRINRLLAVSMLPASLAACTAVAVKRYAYGHDGARGDEHHSGDSRSGDPRSNDGLPSHATHTYSNNYDTNSDIGPDLTTG
jgi:hypothetical protein